MFTFQDIFKSSFLERMTAVSLVDMAIALILSLGIGLFIFFIYKATYSGVMYSANFGLTLIAFTMLTTMLILAVTGNIILSLGMVGALSIVRFRTAVKDPMDIVFIFWSLAAGIVLAAGMLPLAIFGSIFIGLILYFFASKKAADTPYILVVHCNSSEQEGKIVDILKDKTGNHKLKSKSVTAEQIELHFELRLTEDNSDFVADISDLDGVNHAILVSYNGDYMN